MMRRSSCVGRDVFIGNGFVTFRFWAGQSYCSIYTFCLLQLGVGSAPPFAEHGVVFLSSGRVVMLRYFSSRKYSGWYLN